MRSMMYEMDASRFAVGHNHGDWRRVRCPDQVRERNQGGRVYCCVGESRGREACKRVAGWPVGGGGAVHERPKRGEGGCMSLCAMCEREQRGEGVIRVL